MVWACSALLCSAPTCTALHLPQPTLRNCMVPHFAQLREGARQTLHVSSTTNASVSLISISSVDILAAAFVSFFFYFFIRFTRADFFLVSSAATQSELQVLNAASDNGILQASIWSTNSSFVLGRGSRCRPSFRRPAF